ncbi:MAG TPA: Wzz/FepE/Etk N-terminal domain-containing protein [Syntrophobacteria bacterium]|nr:Wzz/FepE/Etk N-terminal domain-containing protein [Syntrophobacteria bacterium]
MPTQPPEQYPQPYPDEDEINLLDYLIVLLKHKRLIAGIVGGAAIVAVVVSLLMTNIYRSEATIAARQQEKSEGGSAFAALRGMAGIAADIVGFGGGGDVDKIEALLKSRELVRRVVDNNTLLPRLFEDDWDSRKKEWRKNPAPTIQDAYKLLVTKGMLTVSRDRKTNIVTIKIDHRDPQFAKDLADYYLTELSESLREETLKDAQDNKRFLQSELDKTSDALLREKISNLLAKEIEKETFARAQKYYSFVVLDPPVVSDLNKKVKPKRALICILSVIVAGFFAVFAAFLAEYVHNVKTREDPERLHTLRRYLDVPLWKRSEQERAAGTGR